MGSVLLCLAFITSGAAQAQSTQHLTYDVYAGGFHVLEADLHIAFPARDRYALKLSAHTFGFLGKLVPWEGSFESEGWINEDDPLYQTELHKSVATWTGETNVKEYHYNRDGSFESLVIDEHDKKPKTETPDAELTQDTLDALTATLNILKTVGSGEKCDGAYDVFDGKRRFTQMFNHKKDVELERSRYNIYEGPAQICEVEIKPVSGAWSKKPRGWLNIQEQGRQAGALPTVWIGQMEEGLPAVPVRILVKTSYGSLVMHLAEYKSGSDLKTADKRGDN